MWWLCRMPVTATVCGVGPDCRELAPWHHGGEDYKVLKRAYDAVTLRGGTPSHGGTSSSSSTSPRTMLHTALNQQCSTLLPPLLDAEKEALRDAIDQELHMLAAGAQHRLVGWSSLEAQDGGVDNTQRDLSGLCAVVLDAEWACLEVAGWGSYSMWRLSSIQLETCWASFDATLVFGGIELLDARGSDESASQEQPQQPEALRFAFDQLKRRLLFVLVMRLLQEVAQRKRFRRQSARRKSKSSPKKKTGSKGINRSSSKNSTSATDAHQSVGTPVEPTPTSLAPGVLAKLHGLTSMSDLNGKYVILESFDEASGRWHVKMTNGGDVKSVKPENLLIASSDESANLFRTQTSLASSANEETSCVVCIAAPAVMAFVPCGHRCICIGCAAQLHGKLREKCPQCRCVATDIIRIFV